MPAFFGGGFIVALAVVNRGWGNIRPAGHTRAGEIIRSGPAEALEVCSLNV